jgi:hypothetical protein
MPLVLMVLNEKKGTWLVVGVMSADFGEVSRAFFSARPNY